jgi:uncharacterized protein
MRNIFSSLRFLSSKKWILGFVLFLLLACNNPAQNILRKPNPPRLVTDVAEMLSPDEQQSLEQKLAAFDDSTSNQILVVTIDSLGNDSIDHYANRLFNTWGIGTKKYNNGVLLLIVKNSRQIRIEVGYGLESVISNEQAGSIIRDILAPNFRNGNYYKGIDTAVIVMEQAAVSKYKIPHSGENANDTAL